MKFLKVIPILLLFLLASAGLKAQAQWDVSDASFKDRLIVGGNVGLSFGDVTYVEVSPRVGYRLTNRITPGIGGFYRYRKQRDITVNGITYEGYSTSDYGFNLFTRVQIYKPLYAHVEYEYLNYEILYTDGTSERLVANSFLIGGGLGIPLGQKAVFIIEALYNVSYQNDVEYPYDSPVILRIGFGVGI